jgi:hypothetical protein
MVHGHNKLCVEIIDALGLKNVRRLDLHMDVGEMVTVTAECFPEVDGMKRLPAILRKFELVEMPEDVTVIGDEFVSYQMKT